MNPSLLTRLSRTLKSEPRLILCLCLLPWLVACKERAIEYSNPVLESPPNIGSPFVGGTSFSLDSYGYVQEEFFFAGEARSFENILPLGEDGYWHVLPAETANYKTRMLVYRPAAPEDFNGTVIVEWLNVTGGLDAAVDWMALHTELLRKGYAWVGISAQYLGVEGGETPLPNPLGFSLALKPLNPNRYGSLSHPGDSFSYDIYGQAAQAIRYPQDIAPLGNLPIQKMIAAGESQSASRLMTFANAFGKGLALFDGYFIHSRLGNLSDFGGASAPLSQPPQADITAPAIVKVRQDLGKPVMNVQTETDLFVLNSVDSRQQDSKNYRLWEVTGSAHSDFYTTTLARNDQGDVASATLVEIYTAIPFQPACPEPINSAPQHHFVAKAALRALNTWVTEGIAPPPAPRWQLNSSGDGFEYDAYGNVVGGIRSPYVDAPIAVLSGENNSVQNNTDICFLLGKTQFLDDATLMSLYPDHQAYVVAVTDAVEDAVAQGYILPEDAQLIISAAQESDIPPL